MLLGATHDLHEMPDFTVLRRILSTYWCLSVAILPSKVLIGATKE